MKSIEQLLELSRNEHYTLSDEEQQRLDTFLSRKSELKKQQKTSSTDSEKNIPATVINKNIVQKDVGLIPTAEQVAEHNGE